VSRRTISHPPGSGSARHLIFCPAIPRHQPFAPQRECQYGIACIDTPAESQERQVMGNSLSCGNGRFSAVPAIRPFARRGGRAEVDHGDTPTQYVPLPRTRSQRRPQARRSATGARGRPVVDEDLDHRDPAALAQGRPSRALSGCTGQPPAVRHVDSSRAGGDQGGPPAWRAGQPAAR
jgi:hypothetical protein